MRRVLSLVVLALLTIGMPAVHAAGPPRSYIVVFKDTVDRPGEVADEHGRAENARVSRVYRYALKGYAASMSDEAASRIAADNRVAYVEQDGEVHSSDIQGSPPNWGLDRIDQRALPLNSSYTYNSNGSGVTAYVIDSGIRISHTDFGGRASSGWDFVDNDSDASDCNGHGTHVAGTIGGQAYGVAKGVNLVAVRVLNCSGSGSWSGVIAGMDWVTQNHASTGTPAVANMSLGGGASSSVDQAVRNSIAAGVTYAIAAGNGNTAGVAQNACNYSPARVTEALTVGATDTLDKKASWSNYGSCLDLFAPGVGIASDWFSNDQSTNTISGTSMATPHVAGVAALYLQQDPGASPATVGQALTSSATPSVVTSAGTGSPNRLLYSLLTPPVGPPPPPPSGTMTVSLTIGAATRSGKNYSQPLQVRASDQASASPLAGAAVTLSVYAGSCTGSKVASLVGTTDSSGNFSTTFKTKNSGNYCTHADVIASGYAPGSAEAGFSIAP